MTSTTSTTTTANPIPATTDSSAAITTTIGDQTVPVHTDRLPADSRTHVTDALTTPMFVDWATKLSHNHRDLRIHRIDLHSIDMFGRRVGFLKFAATITRTDTGLPVPGIVFLRGGAVAILIQLHCVDDGQDYSLLTAQARIPIGASGFEEIPAGMLDGDGHFAGIAAKEMEEETGIKISSNDLVDLTHLAFDTDPVVYPSPGACDEFLRMFFFRKEVTARELEELRGKITGSEEENEHIVLKLVPWNGLWKATRDCKTLTALALYNGLKSEGKL